MHAATVHVLLPCMLLPLEEAAEADGGPSSHELIVVVEFEVERVLARHRAAKNNTFSDGVALLLRCLTGGTSLRRLPTIATGLSGVVAGAVVHTQRLGRVAGRANAGGSGVWRASLTNPSQPRGFGLRTQRAEAERLVLAEGARRASAFGEPLSQIPILLCHGRSSLFELRRRRAERTDGRECPA